MATRRNASSSREPERPPRLLVSREEAKVKLEEELVKGQEFSQRQISSSSDHLSLYEEVTIWLDYCETLLLRLFDTDTLKKDLASSSQFYFMGFYDSYTQNAETERKRINAIINTLKSILQRIDLYELVPSVPVTPQTTAPSRRQHVPLEDVRVFIVHGRDETAKLKVARFIEKLGMNAEILHELPSLGKTVIEKLEHYCDVDFAVVLLTPDDVGSAKESNSKTVPRARQNVVLELGYYLGRLKRDRVCALYVEGVEIPSDFSGVVYVPMDVSDRWHFELAREMRAAGLPVDMNRL